MKNLLTAALLFILLSGSAQAQVRKCTGPDGRVTYSDFICTGSTVKETSVNTNANHIDYSAARQDVEQRKAASDLENPRQSPPPECTFKAFKNNDEKGQVLADKAQLECLRNIEAKKRGQPISKEDYQAWLDHHSLESGKRQALLGRLNSARPTTCTPNGMGALNCR